MKIEFEGEIYNDDRMFVLYLCKCTIEEDENTISTTIHHNEIPENAVWSVITFRNNERYVAVNGKHFKNKKEAKCFIHDTYPEVPLVSLGGQPPSQTLPYQDFVNLNKRNKFEEYDYRKKFPDDVLGAHKETMHSQKYGI